jgi:hypothetical protein
LRSGGSRAPKPKCSALRKRFGGSAERSYSSAAQGKPLLLLLPLAVGRSQLLIASVNSAAIAKKGCGERAGGRLRRLTELRRDFAEHLALVCFRDAVVDLKPNQTALPFS